MGREASKMMDIDTTGFNKTQWDMFYAIKNLEFQRDTRKAELHSMYPTHKPFFVSSDLAKYTVKLKRMRSGLIEYSCSIKNSQDKK
tara:strand:- start:669 stop:926 length:258 start_codon:yes stop_codon:yes gene_type:complete